MDIDRLKLLIVYNLKAAAVALLIIGTATLFGVLIIGVLYFGWYLLNDAPDELRQFVLGTMGACIIGYYLYSFLSFLD